MNAIQICTKNIDLLNYYSNPRVPCRSGIIPSIDLTKWRDFSGLPTGSAAFSLHTVAK